MGDSTEEKSYKGKPRKKQTTKYTYAYIIVEKKIHTYATQLYWYKLTMI